MLRILITTNKNMIEILGKYGSRLFSIWTKRFTIEIYKIYKKHKNSWIKIKRQKQENFIVIDIYLFKLKIVYYKKGRGND